MRARIVGLLTDYGLTDTYVGELKVAILSVNPSLIIVDITHSVTPYSVLEGAFLLYLSYRHFPKESIFVAVVDPGVGTARRGIVLRTSRYWFVGPDNGLMYPAASEDKILSAYVIDASRFKTIGGETFHGRDLFAPVAAMISNDDLSPLIETDPKSLARLEVPRPIILENGMEATILHVDGFGNAVLNISRREFGEKIDGLIGEKVRVRIDGRVYSARIVEAYGQESEGKVVALWGGTGFLELAVVKGSFAKKSRASPGKTVFIELS